MVEWGSPENTIQNAVQQTRLPYWQYDSPVKSQDKKSEPFWFPYLTHVMISARKRPTNMETTKAISVALVLHCMAPLRMSKYPNWSIWRKVTTYGYFRIEVTLRKTRRPSGARSKTPRYIWSSILAQSDWLSEAWVAQIFFFRNNQQLNFEKNVLPSLHNPTDWEISLFCCSWPPGEPRFRHFFVFDLF